MARSDKDDKKLAGHLSCIVARHTIILNLHERLRALEVLHLPHFTTLRSYHQAHAQIPRSLLAPGCSYAPELFSPVDFLSGDRRLGWLSSMIHGARSLIAVNFLPHPAGEPVPAYLKE